MKPERMKYAHDQRAWVSMVDREEPELIKRASSEQMVAARLFADLPDIIATYPGLTALTMQQTSEAYQKARHTLFLLLHYQQMREVNRPHET